MDLTGAQIEKATRERVILEKYELELLRYGNWMNDSCVEIWLEYLMDTLVPDDRSDVSFISPSAMQLVPSGYTSDFFVEDWVGLELPQKNLCLMPINDCDHNDENMEGPGGTHWGLLIYYRPTNTFRMYDTMGGSLRSQCRAAIKELAATFHAEDAKFEVEIHTPRQENSYDCGAYSCSIAADLIKCYLQHERLLNKDELAAITLPIVMDRRQALYKVARRDPQVRGGTAAEIWIIGGRPDGWD